ncbi:aldehyde dehydrogenase family protein [Mycobacterium sp. UM_CSW]|uniref:aldehyde dehydrogenase family protein n=1 Tax=Mycobacterium sp. UM_CSW TaxID=1370119 RepID=UPI00083264DA|nr:aldehyde dehydrogenase family protein [Mycobacterium sp. UM_CSW]
MADLQALHGNQRAAFVREGPVTLDARCTRIDALASMLLDNADDLADAMSTDFGCRARSVSLSSDVLASILNMEHTRSHVAEWMRPRRLNRFGRRGICADLQPDPLGVVGVVAPWNFPIQLAVVPAASALAAGNRVMIKMSEKTPCTAELVAALAGAYFHPDVLTVITGGPEVAARFCSLPFDHLFFTGSTDVGKKVMALAAENLVPVTLELGGKNPAVVGTDADVRQAAARLMGARLVNGGQVCLCPDYALVPRARIDEFVAAALSAARKAFPDPLRDPNYCSLIDRAAYERIVGLIENARELGATVRTVAPQGQPFADAARRKVAPTVLTAVTGQMSIDGEEVFGPVLTVYGYDNVDEAIEFVNARPSPLAAYWYGPRSQDFERFSRSTRSGGVSRNEFALHATLNAAPFGGVGFSGMGVYHGRFGFDTFSHYKPVVGSDLRFNLLSSASSLSPGAFSARVTSAAIRAYAKRISRRRTSTGQLSDGSERRGQAPVQPLGESDFPARHHAFDALGGQR